MGKDLVLKNISAMEDLLLYFEIEDLTNLVEAIETLGKVYKINSDWTDYKKGVLILTFNSDSEAPEFKFVVNNKSFDITIDEIQMYCYKELSDVKAILGVK